jgi:hypothetical protein
MKHEHSFKQGKSKMLKVCVCGRFKFNSDNINPIIEVTANNKETVKQEII